MDPNNQTINTDPNQPPPEPAAPEQSQPISPVLGQPSASGSVVGAPTPQPPPKKSHTLIYIAIIVIIVLAGGAYAYAYQHGHSTKPAKDQTVTLSNSTAKGYDFFSSAKQLGNLAFFGSSSAAQSYITSNFSGACSGSMTATDTSGVCPGTPTYYEIGLTPERQPIIEVSASGSYDGSLTAIKVAPDSYEIIWSLSSTIQFVDPSESQLQAALASNVTVSTTAEIPPLEFPSTVSLDNTSFSLNSGITDGPNAIWLRNAGDLESSYSGLTFTKIGADGQISYYQVSSPNDYAAITIPDSSVVYIDRVLGGVLAEQYSLDNPLNTLRGSTNPEPLGITWTDGQANQNLYQDDISNCTANSQYTVATGITAADLTKVGDTPTGQAVYELPSSSPLLNAYYQTYQANDGDGLIASNLQGMSLQQYQAAYAVILEENGLGQYVVFNRVDLSGANGGCG